MRKVFLLFAALLASGMMRVLAQDAGTPSTGSSSDGSGSEKNFAIELTGTPFSGANRVLNATQMRVRHNTFSPFKTRLGLWLDMESKQMVPHTVYDRTYLSVRPGAEWHFMADADRFSPYAAFDLVFEGSKFRQNTNYGVPVDGAWDANEVKANAYSNRSNFNFGFAISGGFDYVLTKHIYVGMELGLEYGRRRYKEVNYGGELLLDKVVHSSFRSVLGNSFRIGFKF